MPPFFDKWLKCFSSINVCKTFSSQAGLALADPPCYKKVYINFITIFRFNKIPTAGNLRLIAVKSPVRIGAIALCRTCNG